MPVFRKTRDPKLASLGPDYGRIECKLYWLSKDSPHTDTYRVLRDLEMTLHRLVKKTLDLTFKNHDDAWWDDGIPVTIRKRCQTTKEENAGQRLEPYAYTNFIDFKEIMERNWASFRNVLPSDLADDRKKKQLLDALQRVNEIRNGVMHPIKRIPLSKADCDFVRKLRDQLHEVHWRKPIGKATT